MASSSRNNVLQFKILLKQRLKPPIWRRIQVPVDYTFKLLHYAIQDSMGWKSNLSDYHLHAFRMKNNRQRFEIGDECFFDLMETIRAEKQTKLKDYFLEPNTKASYEYDLGFSWVHDVVLEKILPAVEGTAYPKCIAGKGACPPEDGFSSSDEEDGDVDPDPKIFDRNSVIFHEGDASKIIK